MILPPLNAVRAFEATARLLSISKAGEELCVTHAAVSSQIKKLESWIGRKLFERSGRGVALTPAGQQYYQSMQQALGIISAASQSLRVRKDTNAISVACIPSIATRWLIPALAEFTSQFPHITIEVAYSQAHESFDPEKHDVLITHQNVNADDITSTLLFSRINKPVASPRYIERSECDTRLNNAMLLHDEVISAWEDWFSKAGYRPVNLSHGPVYQDFNLLATAVIAGHGVALCPIEVFHRELASGDLVVLSDISTLDDEGYFMLSDKECNRSTQVFCRWFSTVCQQKKDHYFI